MSEPIAKVGMTPCHPGEFIREEILNEPHLPAARAVAILGVRRATLSDLGGGKAALSPEMALRLDALEISLDTSIQLRIQPSRERPDMTQLPGLRQARPMTTQVLDGTRQPN